MKQRPKGPEAIMDARQPAVPGHLRDKIVTGLVTDALTRLGLDGWMDGVLPMRPGPTVIGVAYTVRCAPRRGTDGLGKNLYQIIRDCRPGDVLVIDATGTDTSVFGGNIATCGDVQGLVGMVTDGRCRDFAESSKLRMGVFCRGPTVRLPNEIEIVGQDVPITCGGAQVNPRDLIVADIDGVCVVPSSKIEQAMTEIEDIIQIEAEIGELIRSKGPVAELQKLLKRKKTRKTPAI
jgi:4-hydroxy-4-methyl-2-oxoglutarate aldolase